MIKIGRYTYERIPQDENGEAKLRPEEEFGDEDICILIDSRDGEPIEYLRKVRKTKSEVRLR